MSNVDKHDPGTPAWFDLMTPDLEGARKFYGELFGWTFDVGKPEMGYYTNCKLRGRNAAGMSLRPADAPYPTTWSIYFDTKDVNASAARVKELGGEIMMGPMDVSGEGHMLVCRDTVGATFGYWQPGRHTGAQVADEPGAMAWAEVTTWKGEAARDFYAKALDLEPRKMEGGMEYYTLHRGEKAVAGVMQMTDKFPPGIPSHWMVYFAVKDTQASCDLIKSSGGKVHAGPFETPYGMIAVVADPYGAVFSIIKLSAAASS